MLQNPNIVAEIKQIIANARESAVRAVDYQRVVMYWHVGQRIFEEEQEGKARADYGKYLIRTLAEQLVPEFGIGFSVRQLERYRQFYRMFPIASALRTQFSWTHYKLLLPITDEDKRTFYMAEAAKNLWTARQLERQINSLLYERLLLSNDKAAVLTVAQGEQLPTTPQEIIKDPKVLEFLGLKREAAYYEKDLEQAMTTHLQEFLLELGNGFERSAFRFVARQKRIHLEGDDFYIDLVFYNRLLQCFVLFELKTHKLTHEDLGQLQMYVNYYDLHEKLERENPTIGILLCTDKNNAVVKYTLPQNNQSILASQYQLYLPKEDELKKLIESDLQLLKKDL